MNMLQAIFHRFDLENVAVDFSHHLCKRALPMLSESPKGTVTRGFPRLTPPGGGGTSLWDKMGMCASFG